MAAKTKSAPSEHGANRGEHLQLVGNSETGGWRVDPPGQTDNVHSHRPDLPPGLAKRLDPAPGEETVPGGATSESLSGDDGNNTLVGGAGADSLAGGAGADDFVVEGVADTADGLDQIFDFTSGEDRLVMGAGPGAEDTVGFGIADDFASAMGSALQAVASGADYVAMQVGSDLVVFANTDDDPSTLDVAVVLVGRSLSDIAVGDFA
ncbi:hypothetical protein M9M90_12020 [Phenylobacterium sp. LH3H17]|uniref:M10 family metallopeptidase C-terminal domain-containing protein n=1 Tax=Phenylobacterium sp. LH3H17 TaxID=2903901 RepID=UPI0020C9EDD0|nr:hypothetical protein [Phenylobacterium sp. LH3H17]UTP37966.1 hypothetical protein M9M90_12020 [Phenylobacterium sp. LH3H17]